MRKTKPLGEILVDEGLVTRDQLDEALKVRAERNQLLGKVLVELGLVREADLVAALAKQIGLRFVDLSDIMIDSSAAAMVPEQVARTVPGPADRLRGRQAGGGHGRPGEPVRPGRHPDDHRHGGPAGGGHGGRHRGRHPQVQPVRRVRRERWPPRPARRPRTTSTPWSERLAAVEEGPIVKMVNLLDHARPSRDRASDIHIEPTERDVRIRYRVDGVLHEVMRSPEEHPGRADQPAEGHGRHQHRRAPRPPGRPRSA